MPHQDLTALLACLQTCITATTLHQLGHIAVAMLTISGRVTMLGLARWTEAGGSYRTLQRFFATVIPWPELNWLFVRQHVLRAQEVYLLVGDEVVVTKAGSQTFGVDRFFSGLLQKPVNGLAFFSLSLVATTERRAYPLRVEQVLRAAADTSVAGVTTAQSTPADAPRRPGRPKGSRTQDRTVVTLTPELQRIQAMLRTQRALMGDALTVDYLALDGHFGHNNGMQMALQCGFQLISRLRGDAALYLPYDGPYSGRGARRKYGAKLDYAHLPERFLKHSVVADGVQTQIYQLTALHESFPQPLNVVILVKTKLATGAWGHVILFSSDLALAYDKLVDYYSLRFQIEFTFRDAKQYWGLEDFMNVTERGVTNFANLSLFMVNLVAVLLRQRRDHEPTLSVLDLKADYRAAKYVSATLKCLSHTPDGVLMAQIMAHVAQLGRIHPSHPTPKTSSLA